MAEIVTIAIIGAFLWACARFGKDGSGHHWHG